MLATIAILIPILLSDALNPVLLTGIVYALASQRPYRNAGLVLAGHTIIYLTAGLLLASVLELIQNRLSNPLPMDFAIEIVLGVLLLGLAWYASRPTTKSSARGRHLDTTATLGSLGAFGIGAGINLIGLPFAIPYFAAIGRITAVHNSTTEVVVLLLTYNLAYAAPFAALIVLRGGAGPNADQVLGRVRAWMDRFADWVMPILLVLLGLLFLTDGGVGLWRGTALIPL